MDREWSELLWSLLTRTPVFLITVVGMVWALVQWRKAPNAALFTLLACLGILVASLIFPALFIWFTPMMLRNAPPGAERDYIVWTNRGIIGTWNVCTALCLGALLFAVFAGRAALGRADDRLRRRDVYDDPIAPPVRPPDGETGIQAPKN